MRIVLVEFTDEAQRLLDQSGKKFFLGGDVIVVGLQPKVRAFFLKEGIPCKDTLDYFDTAAQHRVILKSEEWAVKIAGDLKVTDALGIEAGYREACIHYLRLCINHFLWITEILQAIHKKHAPSEIYSCLPAAREWMYRPKGYIQLQERFLGSFTKDFCRSHNIKFYPTYLLSPKSNPILRFFTAVARKAAELVMWLEVNMTSSRISTEDQVVVVPALSYRMDLLLTEIKKDHPKSKIYMIWEGVAWDGISTFKKECYKIYLVLENYIKKLKKTNLLEGYVHLDLLMTFTKINKTDEQNIRKAFQSSCERILNSKGYFTEGGVSVGAYLQEKIDRGLKEEMLTLNHMTAALDYVFKKLNPKLLISMYSGGIYYMMGELSNNYKFPSLNITHGTHVPANNEFERIENYRLAYSVILNSYDHVAVQTPWADKFLDYYKDARRRIKTGPLLFSVATQKDKDSLRDEILANNRPGKIVVYASTQKSREGMRFHITETLDEYISSLSDIVNAVNSLDNVFLVVRPHPACDLADEEFRILLPKTDKLKIITAGSFARVLSAADLLISYSSTCIEEALQNDIPVVLFDKWRRYNHFNLPEWRDQKNVDSPADYVSYPIDLKDVISLKIGVNKNSSLFEQYLVEYKYPKESRSNFFKFVSETLK